MPDAPESAVRVRDCGCGAAERLADNVGNDARSRSTTDDEVDGAAARELRPGRWGATEDGAGQFRSEPLHDSADGAAVAPDQSFCASTERSDDVRDSTDGIDERLEGEVALEGLPTSGGIGRVVVEGVSARIGGRGKGWSGSYVASTAGSREDEGEGRLRRDERRRREGKGAKSGWVVRWWKERAGQRRSGEIVRSRREVLRIVDFECHR
jgi:hypothetical protein